MEYILTTENLTKIYGEKRAADAVSLHIRKGEVYGLIGRNGAGKTTILKIICGLSSATSVYSRFRKQLLSLLPFA